MSDKPSKLIGGKELLAALFNEESRPDIRWVRTRQAEGMPHTKLGRFVFFDLDKVKAWMEKKGRGR